MIKYLYAIKWMVIIIAQLYLAESQLEEKSNRCICPGDILTYECTVLGDFGGITVWMGDFFHCSNGKDTIELVHSQFSNEPGGEASNTRICDNGNMHIVGSIIKTENDSFTSQLNVTLTSDIVGKKIECAYDNGTSIHMVGLLNITTEFIGDLNVENISLTPTYTCLLSSIQFNWDAFPSNCSDECIHYNINTSNCGNCPTTTNHTTVTCIDVPTNGKCEFSVQLEICMHNSEQKNMRITPRCPGQNGPGILLLVVILFLTMLLLFLAILVPLLLKILKKSSTNNGLCSCQKALYEKGLHKEQDTGRKFEDGTKTIKIFDNELHGTYNLDKIDIMESKIEESIQGGSIQLTLDNILVKIQEQVSSHWFKFGRAIGAPANTMEQLKDYSDRDALVEILDYWIKNHYSGQPTWQDVETALKQAGLQDLI